MQKQPPPDVGKQTPHKLFIDDDTWEIIGIDGAHLPSPELVGLPARTASSPDRPPYTRYAVQLSVQNQQLAVYGFTLDGDPAHYTAVLGITPDIQAHTNLVQYSGFAVPFLLTGGLLVGQRRLDVRLFTVGFPKPHLYETVYELRFAGGRHIQVLDYSRQAATLRKKLLTHMHEGRSAAQGAPVVYGVDRDPTTFAIALDYPNWIRRHDG